MIRPVARRPRSIEAKHRILDSVLTRGESLPAGGAALAAGGTVSQRKRSAERAVVGPQALKAMEGYRKTGRAALDGSGLFNLTIRHMRSREAHSATYINEEKSAAYKRAWAFKAADARDYLLRCDKSILGPQFPTINFTKKGLAGIHLKPQKNDPVDYVCLCDLIEYHLSHGGADPDPAAPPAGEEEEKEEEEKEEEEKEEEEMAE